MEPQITPRIESTKDLRSFDSLSPAEKVTVILATVRKPVSKEAALGFAGIDTASLTETELAAVATAFEAAKPVDQSTVGLYVRTEGDELISQMGVDPKEPNKVIADNLIKSMGLDI